MGLRWLSTLATGWPDSVLRQAPAFEPQARRFALIALAIIYSGAERYLAAASKPLHYAFDLALLLALAIILAAKPSRGARRVVPYALWVFVYYIWGFAVAPDRAAVRGDVVRDLLLNGLILSTVALAIDAKLDVTRLARYVQVAVMANVVFALLQAINFHVLVEMAHLLGPGTFSYNIYRPAGLWVDPNVAGICYLFGFLISLLIHDRPAIAWAGRAASAVGILFTGSREAMYPLIVSGLILGLAEAYRHRFQLRRLAGVKAPAWVPAVVGIIVLGVALAVWFSPIRGALGYDLHRFVDASARGPAEPSRIQLATFWINRAIHGPWLGAGVFSFQGNGRTIYGAHNIYLTVWGEVGAQLLMVYLAVLALGVIWVLRSRIPGTDRLTLLLMWLAYLAVGFTWHNQFSAVEGIVVVGLLYRLSAALDDRLNPARLRTVGSVQRPRLASPGS